MNRYPSDFSAVRVIAAALGIALLCVSMVLFIGFAFTTHARGAVLDFDNLTPGFAPPSVSVAGRTFEFSYGGRRARGPAIFDTTLTAHGSNGDPDLVPVAPNAGGVSGNVLILQGPGDVPNDLASGGWIGLTLTSGDPVRLRSASVIDDGSFAMFRESGGSSTLLGMTSVAGEGQTALIKVALDHLFGVGDRLRLSMSGSGGWDNLVFGPDAAVPLPPAIMSFLAALAILGAIPAARRARAGA